MPAVAVLFYREADAVPVLDWLDEQSADAQDRCTAAIVRLSEQGHTARRPLIENLGSGIYELRVKLGRVNYRILFCFSGRTAVLLTNGFTKEREVPVGEIEIALQRKAAFEADPANHYLEMEE